MHRLPIIRSILLLGGAFTFAFLLAEMVHDSGHYLCHKAYGNIQVQVRFDPFGGTHINGTSHLPAEVLAITSDEIVVIPFSDKKHIESGAIRRFKRSEFTAVEQVPGNIVQRLMFNGGTLLLRFGKEEFELVSLDVQRLRKHLEPVVGLTSEGIDC